MICEANMLMFQSHIRALALTELKARNKLKSIIFSLFILISHHHHRCINLHKQLDRHTRSLKQQFIKSYEILECQSTEQVIFVDCFSMEKIKAAILYQHVWWNCMRQFCFTFYFTLAQHVFFCLNITSSVEDFSFPLLYRVNIKC